MKFDEKIVEEYIRLKGIGSRDELTSADTVEIVKWHQWRCRHIWTSWQDRKRCKICHFTKRPDRKEQILKEIAALEAKIESLKNEFARL